MTKQPIYTFLNGGGSMGELARKFNWEVSPLGDPADWPISLRTITSLVLRSTAPMVLFWGKDLVQLFNDAYQQLFDIPDAVTPSFGIAGKTGWGKSWELIEAEIINVLNGKTVFQHTPEATQFNLISKSWSAEFHPVSDDTGKTAGVFIQFIKTLPETVHQKAPDSGSDGIFSVATEKSVLRREAEAGYEKFRSFVMEAPFATAVYSGSDLIIDLANDAMLHLWGKSSNVLGMPLDKALPELQGQPFLDLLQEVRTTGTAYSSEEQSADLVVDGILQSFWFNFTYKPLFDESGQVYGILNMAVDITEQVKSRQKIEEATAKYVALQRQQQEALEEIVSQRTLELARTNDELHKTNELLQQSNEELTQYAYVASHDLQEPLRKIRMFSSMLSNSYGLPPEIAMTIGKIEKSAGRMSSLVKDLLEFSQLLKSDALVRRVNLNEIIHSIISDLELVIEEKSARIVVDDLPVIEGVEQQITQLFYNLIGNALKFSPAHRSPVVEISCSMAPAETLAEHFNNLQPVTDYYHLLVKDNGIGFDPMHREQIFEIFKRLHGHSAFSGTGIGLALCRRIVENHKGRIFAESKLDGGAVFHILLPAIAGIN